MISPKYITRSVNLDAVFSSNQMSPVAVSVIRASNCVAVMCWEVSSTWKHHFECLRYAIVCLHSTNLVSWHSWLHCPASLAEAGLGAGLELRPVHCHHQGSLVQKCWIEMQSHAMVLTRRTSRSSLSLILRLSSTSEMWSTRKTLKLISESMYDMWR